MRLELREMAEAAVTDDVKAGLAGRDEDRLLAREVCCDDFGDRTVFIIGSFAMNSVPNQTGRLSLLNASSIACLASNRSSSRGDCALRKESSLARSRRFADDEDDICVSPSFSNPASAMCHPTISRELLPMAVSDLPLVLPAPSSLELKPSPRSHFVPGDISSARAINSDRNARSNDSTSFRSTPLALSCASVSRTCESCERAVSSASVVRARQRESSVGEGAPCASEPINVAARLCVSRPASGSAMSATKLSPRGGTVLGD